MLDLMDEIIGLIDILRLLIGSLILFYASYTDIRTRKAPNVLWILMAASGGILLVLQFFTPQGFGTQIFYLIFIPVMIGLVFILPFSINHLS